MIHCTPITAALLTRVHLVPAQFVVAHGYGETWSHQSTNITFYDANHCPGAAILLIQLVDGTAHLHCGDMRYHDKMKGFPLLAQAVQNRKLDLVYLDTTYGHPKHDFMPQDEAVDAIASTVCDELSKTRRTLILLSCYSIGKEKVLWECASRTNQLVHVTTKKYNMLECILQGEGDVSNQILDKCTLDPSKTDIHVIPMGLAGEMWPYFRPSYHKCAEYVEGLDKMYDAVVAFLPTGWADASKWNKKNNITSKQVDYKRKQGSIHVEIRLVGYSEHSAFSELQSFVNFLKPRKVIPTVFGDDNDRRKIENHFRNMIDSTRAKKTFFKTMTSGSHVLPMGATHVSPVASLVMASSSPPPPSWQASSSSKKRKATAPSSENIRTLVAMGFNSDAVQSALIMHANNLDSALNDLLEPKLSATMPSSRQEPIEIDLVDASCPSGDSSPPISSGSVKKKKAPS